MITAVDAWEHYARTTRPRRAINAAGAATWLNWTQYADHGPSESVLGDLRGRSVLELGSGTGANLAHLATMAARCVGVDLAPSRTVTARKSWGIRPNLDFVTADAVDYLTTTSTRFDIVYSIFGAVWFTDAAVLLPLVRNGMTAGGVFAFSQLPAIDEELSTDDRVIRKWNHPAETWVSLLTVHGFGSVAAEIVPAPRPRQLGTLLVRAKVDHPT